MPNESTSNEETSQQNVESSAERKPQKPLRRLTTLERVVLTFAGVNEAAQSFRDVSTHSGSLRDIAIAPAVSFTAASAAIGVGAVKSAVKDVVEVVKLTKQKRASRKH